MKTSISRRHFVKTTAFAGATLAALNKIPSLKAESANNKIRVAVMGVHGRGMDHINAILNIPDVELAYVCDVDAHVLASAIKHVESKGKKAPQGVNDFRKILDDKSVDAITIATPNHWHAIAAIMACSAGKHVYVEKPGSHDPNEAELLVKAARKNNRVVQLGTQRRSSPSITQAIEKVHSGAIGRALFARCWYNSARSSIGHGKTVPVPDWLDFTLWQGAAPDRPYVDNLVHYNWHWRWHWGNGELGNNGIHVLDLARWGLGAGLPKRVTCSGARYYYNDDQETPDTYLVGFDFGDKGASFEGHSCNSHGLENAATGVLFYGDKGSLAIADKVWRIYDGKNKVVEEQPVKFDNVTHFANFFDCIRSGKKPNADIGEGQQSTLLCHLGNIAWRTGHTINFDPATRKIVNDPDAGALWQREYRPGWEPKV